ncbi:hypothetical protein BASA81_012174 [Batrachochytrium salamandrivorans]|nr:hypothetical protein BASA81_012174 [Batrachochytrium salamandrivorans]
MQFFYLFSFVVVASYAAALPQPAGLSEKHSNNVDTTLTSGLEARSYQPGLNSYKESVTLMSLKRRADSEGSSGDNSEGSSGDNSEGSAGDNSEGSTGDNPEGSVEDNFEGSTGDNPEVSAGDNSDGSTGDNSEGSTGDNSEGSTGDNSEGSTGDNSEGSTGDNSEGSSGDNSGSGTPPPTPPVSFEKINYPFENMNVSFMNLASTIDKAENSTFIFFQDGELTAQKIGGDVGDMMGKYFKMSGYVAAALDFWSRKLVPGILGAIESGLGKDEYSKILPELELIREKTDRALRAGFQRVDILFKNGLYSSMEFLRRLRPQLEKFGGALPRLDNPLDIRLHGQLVSRVESYKYLGVLIDSKLDHSAWLKQKRSALEHTISALHPVLTNHQLTVNYRSRIFSAVVMGKAYYGLELVGGNKSHLAPLQTTINKGIRLFIGARLSTAIGPLLVETGIGYLLTRSLVSRVRLLERSATKRTPC